MEIKWIKITTDIFDDEKIKLIDSMPDRDALIVIWFKLLTLAGKKNANGLVFLSNRLAYTDEMLSTIFNRPINTVRLALKTFQQFEMIEIADNEIISIRNWEKHQNVEGLTKIREQNKLRQKAYRERIKAEQEQICNVTSRDNNAIDKIRIDKNRIEDKTLVDKNEIDFFIDNFKSICKSLPQPRSISLTRKKLIKTRMSEYSKEEILEVLRNVENSNYLTGKVNGWKASFDWILNVTNFIKVLEGNYNNNKTQQSPKGDFYRADANTPKEVISQFKVMEFGEDD